MDALNEIQVGAKCDILDECQYTFKIPYVDIPQVTSNNAVRHSFDRNARYLIAGASGRHGLNYLSLDGESRSKEPFANRAQYG